MSEPQSQPSVPLTRERLIEMLDNYASGLYQAISPDVVAEAARQLRNSKPREELGVSMP